MKTLAFPYVLTLALLTGCAGTTESGINSPIVNSATPLSAVTIKDEQLRICVAEAAGKNQWKTLGEVTSLNCSRIGRGNTLIPDDPRAIKDLSEIKYFTALRDLNVVASAFTKIDVSTLVQLERLDVYGATITELDLKKNTRLKRLNIGATGITTLDLQGLINLEELYTAEYCYPGDDFYTDACSFEARDLRASFPDRLPLTISLDPRVKLKAVTTGDNTTLDLPDNSALIHASGRFTLRSISGASQLQSFHIDSVGGGLLDLSAANKLQRAELHTSDTLDIHLSPSLSRFTLTAPVASMLVPAMANLSSFTFNHLAPIAQSSLSAQVNTRALDLSNATVLQEAQIRSKDINQLSVAASLVNLEVAAPLAQINIPDNAKLASLSLANNGPAHIPLTANLPASLVTLSIENYALGKSFDLHALLKLEQLRFKNPAGLYSIGLPNKYLRVELSDVQSGMPSFSPGSSIIGLSLSQIKGDSFTISPELTNLEDLYIKNCNLQLINFANHPYITSIEISGAPLKSVDLSPFAGRKSKKFALTTVGWDEAMKADLLRTARSYFYESYVF